MYGFLSISKKIGTDQFQLTAYFTGEIFLGGGEDDLIFFAPAASLHIT